MSLSRGQMFYIGFYRENMKKKTLHVWNHMA